MFGLKPCTDLFSVIRQLKLTAMKNQKKNYSLPSALADG
jgi:hypothetical protein